jgi:predicted O-methyltransferase YrrM
MGAIPPRPHSLVDPLVAQAMCERARLTPPGCFIEVGVYHGGSAWFLAQAAQQQLRLCYLYDTFKGIPYRGPHDSHEVGDFADTTLEEVQKAVPTAVCIAGVFPQSAINTGPIAFVHLDCDQYQSYQDALDYFDSRIVKGGVIWCDDVDCLKSATLAVGDYCSRTGRTLCKAEKPYIQF